MHRRWPDIALILGAGGGAVGLGLAISFSPVLGLGMAIVFPLLYGLISLPAIRLVTVTLGALLVFQSTSSGGKYAYLAIAALCFGVSAVRVARSNDRVILSFQPMMFMGIALIAYLGLSLLVARSNGGTIGNWAGDSLPYLLLAALPVVGIDAYRCISPKSVGWIISILGVLTAVGFALDWLNRRHVSDLGVGRILLATATLPILAFVYGIVRAARGRNLVAWSCYSALVASLLLATGARTYLVLAFAYPAVVGDRDKFRVRPIRVISAIATGVAGAILLVPRIVSFAVADDSFITQRIAAALAAVQNGDDQSLQIRDASYAHAQEVFFAHEWLGIGPGHIYPEGSFTLDTPWLVLAKFGIIGTAVVVVYLFTIAWSIRRLRVIFGYSEMQTVARGFCAVLVVMVPFGPWTEDKGTALTLMILVASIAGTAAINTSSGSLAGIKLDHTPQQVEKTTGSHPVTGSRVSFSSRHARRGVRRRNTCTEQALRS